MNTHCGKLFPLWTPRTNLLTCDSLFNQTGQPWFNPVVFWAAGRRIAGMSNKKIPISLILRKSTSPNSWNWCSVFSKLVSGPISPKKFYQIVNLRSNSLDFDSLIDYERKPICTFTDSDSGLSPPRLCASCLCDMCDIREFCSSNT